MIISVSIQNAHPYLKPLGITKNWQFHVKDNLFIYVGKSKIMVSLSFKNAQPYLNPLPGITYNGIYSCVKFILQYDIQKNKLLHKL